MPRRIWRTAGLLAMPTCSRGAGSASCPCVTESPLYAEYGSGGVLKYRLSGQTYDWPGDFGTGRCNSWENGLQPHCEDLSGMQTPGWCNDRWCYIDPDNCAAEISYERSLFWPRAVAYFSYATCGSSNTFTEWFSSSQSSYSITEFNDVIGGYACSIKYGVEEEIEAEYGTGVALDCAMLDGTCPCGEGCVREPTWGQCVDFHTTRITSTKSLSRMDMMTRCVGRNVAAYFGRIAGKEHVVRSRVAYAYMGTQADGAITQYPGLEWCPTTYDARFRPWYATAASGPKDVVVILDMSGSMDQHGRAQLAKDAAVAVLDTLTEADFAAFVAFSGCTSVYSDSMTRVSNQARHQMKEWILGMKHGGGTKFVAALARAFTILARSRESSDRWTGCVGSTVVLFLSDGAPSDWDNGHYAWLRGLNQGIDAHIFTYTLGEQAQADITRQIACENGGLYQHIGDGGNLKDVMAGYYQFFTGKAGNRDRQNCQARWVEYADHSTCTTLLAACVPLHNWARRSPDTNEAELFGAVCVDANMVVSIDTLRDRSDWPEFYGRVISQQRRCLDPPTPARTMELQRLNGQACGSDIIAAPVVPGPDAELICDLIDEHSAVSFSVHECTPGSDMEKCPAVDTSEEDEGGFPSVAVALGIVALLLVSCLFFLYQRRLANKQPKQVASPHLPLAHQADQAKAPTPAPITPIGTQGSGNPLYYPNQYPPVTPQQEMTHAKSYGGPYAHGSSHSLGGYGVPPLAKQGGRGAAAGPGGRGGGSRTPPRSRSATGSPRPAGWLSPAGPQGWATGRDPPQRGWCVQPITDHAVQQSLQMCLVTRPELLGVGHDVRQAGKYSRLVLARAWRIEHHILWHKYHSARMEVSAKRNFVGRSMLRNAADDMQQTMSGRDGLYNWPRGLRAHLDASINEAITAHGTTPGSVYAILDSGLNERYCSLDGLFGGGAYLAEDCGKCDQYVTADRDAAHHPELNQLLYQQFGIKHPLNVYYIILCRVMLGAVVRTADGITSIDTGQSVWAGRDKRELAAIPGSHPPAPYHSLLAETGPLLKRYREVVVFHSERVYPEYLLAYWRR